MEVVKLTINCAVTVLLESGKSPKWVYLHLGLLSAFSAYFIKIYSLVISNLLVTGGGNKDIKLKSHIPDK